MSGINKVLLIGRLGADPELKYTSSGQSVTNFNLATSERWMGKDGQPQERTEWHRVVVWGKPAENCAKYLSKGRQAYVEGRLQTRSWEDQQGQKRYTTEVVANTVQFLSSGQGAQQDNSSQSGGNDFGPEPDFNADEEIPF